MKYEETTAEKRWLILSDKDQKFPEGNLEVISSEEKKTASGKSMPVLTLQKRETGDIFQICAWKRDVLLCINEYGTDTDSWSDVQFEQKNGRWQLVPAPMQVIEEKVE